MKKLSRPLRLYEDVMLLALRNDKGTTAGGVMYAQAVGGALLAAWLIGESFGKNRDACC